MKYLWRQRYSIFVMVGILLVLVGQPSRANDGVAPQAHSSTVLNLDVPLPAELPHPLSPCQMPLLSCRPSPVPPLTASSLVALAIALRSRPPHAARHPSP